MNIADFITDLILGISWLELDSYQQYAVIVGCIGIVTMVIEKVFGLLALAVKDAKRGGF